MYGSGGYSIGANTGFGTGVSATGYGSGGGGAWDPSGAGYEGGSGAPGIIIITEYIS